MSLKVTIEGQGSFEVAKECVKKVVYKTDIPLDSNARTKDVGSTLEISGKILTATDGDPFDSTRQMGLWSMVPAENSACYRKVTVEIIQAGIVERKYYFPNAFVVNYDEDFGDTDGVGTFRLTAESRLKAAIRLPDAVRLRVTRHFAWGEGRVRPMVGRALFP